MQSVTGGEVMWYSLSVDKLKAKVKRSCDVDNPRKHIMKLAFSKIH